MKKSGDIWEVMAIKYLQLKWYKILETNFKYWRVGEIDIVTQKDGITIFIEVKYRSNFIFWTAEESITKRQLFKIQKTLEFYCMKNHVDFEEIRFDVICINRLDDGTHKFNHYVNETLVY